MKCAGAGITTPPTRVSSSKRSIPPSDAPITCEHQDEDGKRSPPGSRTWL